MLVSLTVGKVDAGVAVLLTEDKRLIEFPSILLPPDISSGSIVDINVSRNFESEQRSTQHFAALQEQIFSTFGLHSPSPPVLRCRNATQTSVVLEWDPMNLATAELRSLSLYRNGSKAGNIPRDKLSTKISGLAVDTEYTFHLILRTSAGTYTSEKLTVRTQKMTDLTGITITPGVMPSQLREDLAATVERIGAKLIDTVRIDTTHFVCSEGRGQAWEKAVEMNVPVVVPDWIKGCEREGRIVGVRGYYLNADPKLRQVGPGVANQSQTSLGPQSQQGQGHAQAQPPANERRPSSLSQHSQLRVQPPLTSPRIEHTPPTPERTHPDPQTNGADEPPTPPPKTGDGAPVTKHSPLSEAETASAAAPATPPAEPPVVSETPSEVESEAETFPGANPAPAAEQEQQADEQESASNGVETQPKKSQDVAKHVFAESGSTHTPALSPKSQPVNNLKAIGIPHGAEPDKDEAATEAAKEEDGGFDEVSL